MGVDQVRYTVIEAADRLSEYESTLSEFRKAVESLDKKLLDYLDDFEILIRRSKTSMILELKALDAVVDEKMFQEGFPLETFKAFGFTLINVTDEEGDDLFYWIQTA